MLPVGVLDNLHPTLQDRVGQWETEPELAPPPQWITLLTDCHDQPWLNLLTAFVLESTPEGWRTTLKRIREFQSCLRRAWEQQGHPSHLTDLNLEHINKVYRDHTFHLIAVAIDIGVARRQLPAGLLDEARHLCPDLYLHALGWDNLAHLPAWMLTQLAARSGSPSRAVPGEHVRLCRTLYSHRHEPWFVVAGAAALTLLNQKRSHGSERFSPQTIVGMVNRLAMVLSSVFRTHELTSMTTFDADKHLRIYLKDGPGEESSRTRVVEVYLQCRELQELLIHSDRAAAPMVDVQLPKPTVDLNLRPRIISGLGAEQARRIQQVDTLAPLYPAMLRIAVQRSAFFRLLRRADEAAQTLMDGERQSVAYSVTLPDQSAVLDFKVRTVAEVVAESNAEKPPLHAATHLSDVRLTEYLGARDIKGNPSTEPFFAPVYRSLYGIHTPDPHLNQSDLNFVSSIVKPYAALSLFCHRTLHASVRAGRPPRVLMNVRGYCAEMALGILLHLILRSTGLRLHEAQQILIERGGVGIDQHGRIQIRVYPKGHKRDRLRATYHILPLDIEPFWKEWMSLTTFKTVLPEYGEEYNLTAGRYLFQHHGHALSRRTLTAALRMATYGTLPSGTSNDVKLTAHVIRYLYARSRDEGGDDIQDIRHALGHSTIDMTLKYTSSATTARLPLPAGNGWMALSSTPVHHT